MKKQTNAQLLAELIETKRLLEVQKQVSNTLSEEVAQLKGDRSTFRNIIDAIGTHLFGWDYLQHKAMSVLPDEVKKLILEVEYQRGAAGMAHTITNSIVDKMVQVVEKSNLQNRRM